MTDGVTKKVSKSLLLDLGLSVKIDILANPYIVKLKRDGEGSLGSSSFATPSFQEKLLGLIIWVPVPRTATGGQGEYPKVSERTMVKELGKMTP